MSKGVVVGCVLGVLTAVGSPARAGVSEVYVFSVFSTSPGDPTAAPFTVTGTDGVRLGLNSASVATSATDVAANVLGDINTGVSYSSHSGQLDKGEHFTDLATRVNGELSVLDDVGLVSEKIDAPCNVDFGKKASLVLQFGVPLGDLVIEEDSGLDPLKLEYSATADFASPLMLFNGFSKKAKKTILKRSDFGGNDTGDDVDQMYYFKFDEALGPGYLRITEIGNYGGSRLEVDFVGGTEGSETPVIPEPSGFVLAGIGLVLAILVIRRTAA